MNGFIAGTVFIWPAGGNGGIQPPTVCRCALEPGVCASFRCGFAPHTRESLILPLRGANFSPGKGAVGCGSLRLPPRKGLFFRREAQTRESLILPLRGANLSPGKAPGGCESLRLPPGKALFFRREAQTLRRGIRPEKPPAAAGVCASLPGKAYSSVERRKPFARESARSFF